MKLGTNPHNVFLHKYVDGDCYGIPTSHPDPLMYIEPGDHHTWTLSGENDGIEEGDVVPPYGGTDDVIAKGLGGGIYAFRGRGWFEDEGRESAKAFAATFEFDADPLTLTPSSLVERVEWDGDTLVAEMTRERDDPTEDGFRQAEVELRHVDDPSGEPPEWIVEQILTFPELRDTVGLAYEHDADVVRLESVDARRLLFDIDDDFGPFGFQGDAFELTTRELK